MKPRGSLAGKVAIVTGAGQGIGRAEAMLLAAEGAEVVVNDLGSARDGPGRGTRLADTVVADIVATGGAAIANDDDIASWSGGEALVRQALDVFGRLDILICNAGIVRDRTVVNMVEAEWDDVIRVHLKGHFIPVHFAAAHWREITKSSGRRAGGRIVMTASTSGLYGNPGQANYGASKAGIAGMSLIVARELERYGVTCNAICPRARTRMTAPILGDHVPAVGEFDAFHPDNVAPMVAYLCSDDAAHVSGQTFVVFGGTIELLEPWAVANRISKADRWTVKELAKAQIDLFAGRSSSPPAIPKIELPPQG